MYDNESKIILYTTDDGKSQFSLMSRDGRIWLNQKQMAELFAVSKPNISMLIAKIFAATIPQFHISTFAQFHNFTFAHFRAGGQTGESLPLTSFQPFSSVRQSRSFSQGTPPPRTRRPQGHAVSVRCA